jgi:hypothetical protein
LAAAGDRVHALRMRMMRTFRSVGVAAAITALASGAHAQPAAAPDRASDAQAIRAHIESIFQAFIDKDRPALERTHGANWRGFTPWPESVIRGRDNYMKYATFPPDLQNGQGMVGYRISDFDVVFYGDTAVVSFIADVDRVFGGETNTQKLTLLDVYHKEPGGWTQVASNTSFHGDELEQIGSMVRPLESQERAAVLAARERVWRAWFAGDTASLAQLIPPELITIDGVAGAFGTRDSTLDGSRRFASSGSKLARLAFPRTECQAYGNTVILYTSYEIDIEERGVVQTERGLATEVFVHQKGQWVNTGWQLAPAPKP